MEGAKPQGKREAVKKMEKPPSEKKDRGTKGNKEKVSEKRIGRSFAGMTNEKLRSLK